MQIKKPKGAPKLMPAKIWKPVVKKVGMEYLDKPETEAEKVVESSHGPAKISFFSFLF